MEWESCSHQMESMVQWHLWKLMIAWRELHRLHGDWLARETKQQAGERFSNVSSCFFLHKISRYFRQNNMESKHAVCIYKHALVSPHCCLAGDGILSAQTRIVYTGILSNFAHVPTKPRLSTTFLTHVYLQPATVPPCLARFSHKVRCQFAAFNTDAWRNPKPHMAASPLGQKWYLI